MGFPKITFPRGEKVYLNVFAIVLLVFTGYEIFHQSNPEWKSYQKEFKRRVQEKFGEAQAEGVEFGIKQIYIPKLQRVDRCITCHQGVEWEGLENAPNPFKTHPKPELIDKHLFKDYGCTLCHGGQGYATTYDEAHGLVEFWDEPLLSKKLGQYYGLPDPEALIQLNCNVCHRYDRSTPGMDYINQAKELIHKFSCRACHIINGRGGSVGPDLTWEGDKFREAFAMPGIRSVFEWQFRHFMSPKDVSFHTVMPSFEFSRQQAAALTMLVLSWKRREFPPEYIPGAEVVEERTPEEERMEKMAVSGEGAFFAQKGCFTCHSVSVFGIISPTNIGPDLTFAKEDVKRRFGSPLEVFLHSHPSGTMQIVLSSVFPLTKEEKDQAIALLNRAWELKEEKKIPAPWERPVP